MRVVCFGILLLLLPRAESQTSGTTNESTFTNPSALPPDTAPVTATPTTPEATVNASINGTDNPLLTGGNVETTNHSSTAVPTVSSESTTPSTLESTFTNPSALPTDTAPVTVTPTTPEATVNASINGTGNPPLTGGNVETTNHSSTSVPTVSSKSATPSTLVSNFTNPSALPSVTATPTTPETTANASINGTGNPPLTGGNVARCSATPALCCPGRNDSCHRGCFCDEYCVSARDCCADYIQTCRQGATNNTGTAGPTVTSGPTGTPALGMTFNSTHSTSFNVTNPTTLTSSGTRNPDLKRFIVDLKASSTTNGQVTQESLKDFVQLVQGMLRMDGCNNCTLRIIRTRQKPTDP